MFFRRKKKKEPEQAPVWFMWLMGGFVAYALITNIFTDKVKETQEKTAPVKLEETEYFNYAIVAGKGFGGPARPLYLRDITLGEGDVADCWHTVTLDYKLYKNKTEVIEDTKLKEPITFTIGRGQVPKGLERGAFGMRVGGARAVTAHPIALYADYDFYHPQMSRHDYGGYILKMRESTRPLKLPFSDLGLRIYDDVVGEGHLAQCTDKVRIKLRAWRANGEPIWRKRAKAAIMIDIGEGNAPYAIERGLLGMKVGGKRTLLVPPGYMNPLFGKEKAEKLKLGHYEDVPIEDAVEEIAPEVQDDVNASDAAAQEDNAEMESAAVEAVVKEPDAQTPTESVVNREGALNKTQEERGEEIFKKAAEELRARSEYEFEWDELPVPGDEVIIIELELLPLKLELPKETY